MSAYPVTGVPVAGSLFLAKPFTSERLVGQVREILGAPSPFGRRRV